MNAATTNFFHTSDSLALISTVAEASCTTHEEAWPVTFTTDRIDLMISTHDLGNLRQPISGISCGVLSAAGDPGHAASVE